MNEPPRRKRRGIKPQGRINHSIHYCFSIFKLFFEILFVTIQSPAGDSGNRHKPQSGLPLFSVPVAQ
jgi:hypothetical protein